MVIKINRSGGAQTITYSKQAAQKAVKLEIQFLVKFKNPPALQVVMYIGLHL
jgi:hypothetical protein